MSQWAVFGIAIMVNVIAIQYYQELKRSGIIRWHVFDARSDYKMDRIVIHDFDFVSRIFLVLFYLRGNCVDLPVMGK